MGSTFRRSFTWLVATALCFSLAQGTAHASPTISIQPTSQTGAVNGTVSLSVLALGGPGGGVLQYQWRKGNTNLANRAAGGGLSGIAGATGDTLTISSLQTADFAADYNVIVTDDGGSVTSQSVSISPSQGPFNALGGTSGARINFSAYVESADGTSGRGRPVSATMPYSGVEREARIFYLPDQQGSASWILFPESGRGDLGAPLSGGGNCGATQSLVTMTWTGAVTNQFCMETAIGAGSSMTVEQVSPGSLQIRATVMSPKFSGIVEPLVETAYGVNFQVFDDATGELIPIGISGRLGVVRSLSGATMLQTVDPLVLPASALGTRIRVGALLYYYSEGYNALGSPERYAALSDPIFMAQGGDPSQWRTVRQALPMPASGSCEGISDADFAWGTNLTGGWQRAWEPWVNPELDANGNRIGGWACMRVLVHRGGPWLVDNG